MAFGREPAVTGEVPLAPTVSPTVGDEPKGDVPNLWVGRGGGPAPHEEARELEADSLQREENKGLHSLITFQTQKMIDLKRHGLRMRKKNGEF